MKILVIEDDAKLAEYLRKGLREEGYVVEVARNGIDGLHMASEGAYSLILLDGMLPGIDGLSVLAALRQSPQARTPILMLTARGRVEDRVQGLRAGANDYVVKPFAFTELLARIEVLLRSSFGGNNGDDTQLVVANLHLDLARRRATRDGQRLDLSAKEFQLLSLLMRRTGEVLSRTRIAEEVWDIHFDRGTNVIDVAVRRLRAKLDAPFTKPLLHTVRGMGYVLESRPE